MIRRKTSRFGARRRGLVLALAALMMPLVVGAMAMALDGGVLYLQRRQAQSAADASALAGAYALFNGSNFTVAQSAAITMGTHNGFTIPSANVTQPTSTQIAVKVTASPPRFFSGLWGKGSMSVSASATAQASSGSSSTTPYSTSAVVLLDPSASGSLYMAGSAQINATGGIQVNSNSTTAVNANNAGGTSSPINVVGRTTTSSGGFLTGTVTTGVASVGNPLSSLTAPTNPGSSANQNAYMNTYPGYGSWTMQPGQYSSSVSLGNGGSFTMQPGLYYFTNGADLTIANGATLSGSGVTIYMDSGSTISFQGGTTTTLSAPSSSSGGTIPGVVYMQNPTSTASPSFANGTNVNLTGTFYAAGASLSFAGGNLSNFASQVVVDSMNLSNDAQITVNYSSVEGREQVQRL